MLKKWIYSLLTFQISKHDLNHEKYIMLNNFIHNDLKRKRMALLSALLRQIFSKYDGNFYCLNYLHFCKTKTKLESHKKVCDKKHFFGGVIPFKDTKILQFNQD